MRIRFFRAPMLVLLLGLLPSLSLAASVAHTTAVRHRERARHHEYGHLRRTAIRRYRVPVHHRAVAERREVTLMRSRGMVAGHARHTVLADPARVGTVDMPVMRTVRATRRTPVPSLRRIRWVPPLRGSLASLLRQNERDQAEGLVRIEDTAQLDDLEAEGALTPLPASVALRVNPSLPMDRRYCRPWTARFLADLAASHYARFHRPLQVNSAVRTVAFQRELERVNGNAAAAEGDLASPHLTGAAVDIGKHGMTFSEIAWMRAWLLPLQTAGKIDVEEEFYQACFHVTVYRSYVPPPAARLVARRHHASTTLLATGVQ